MMIHRGHPQNAWNNLYPHYCCDHSHCFSEICVFKSFTVTRTHDYHSFENYDYINFIKMEHFNSVPFFCMPFLLILWSSLLNMVRNYDRPMHEITFSTVDKPKLLSQVVGCALLFDILLNNILVRLIENVHPCWYRGGIRRELWI